VSSVQWNLGHFSCYIWHLNKNFFCDIEKKLLTNLASSITISGACMPYMPVSMQHVSIVYVGAQYSCKYHCILCLKYEYVFYTTK